MRIQLLSGGLANHAFQYIFARFAERYHPDMEPWYFDDSHFFFQPSHNGYELEKVFGIKANLLSNYFSSDVWEEIIRLRKQGTSLPQTFLNMGLPITVLAETNDFNFNGKVLWTPVNEFHPEILNLPDKNIYYHGYWINKNWFSTYREENLEEFTFPKLIGADNLRYAEKINSSISVGVHIRRGDFVTGGLALPVKYYYSSCQLIAEKVPNSHFFVFSDDIPWCKAHVSELGLDLAAQITYVVGNANPNNYIDMQLLSLCQGMIMSNSSFCYLAALLDRNLKIWVNPTKREI